MTRTTSNFETHHDNATPDAEDSTDVAAIRRYIGSCLLDEWQMSTSAGHGENVFDLLRDDTQPDWVRLDMTTNVRPMYDRRFVNFYAPKRIIERLCTLAKVVEVADLNTLLIIVQDFADYPQAEHRGFRPEWKREKPDATHRYIGDTISALAGASN